MEGTTCCGATKPMHPQVLSRFSRGQEPRLLKPRALQPVLHNGRRPCKHSERPARRSWRVALPVRVLTTQWCLTLPPHELQPTRLLCPWNSPGKNIGVGCHLLLQGIFPTQGSNPSLLHCWQILYHLSHREAPRVALAHCNWRKVHTATKTQHSQK